MARVLHIIDTLSGAGPTRSLQASVEYLAAVGQRHEHAVVTLRRPSYPPALLRARKAGLAIYQAPGNPELDALIVAADRVQLHYWNNPAFLSFLRRASPAHRRLAWFKVLGRHAPQVISPTLLQAFDAVMLSSELSLGLPALRGAARLAGMVEVVPGRWNRAAWRASGPGPTTVSWSATSAPSTPPRLGPVTLAGCAGKTGVPRCIQARTPCRGCFGPIRKGARPMVEMMGALTSVGLEPKSLIDRRAMMNRYIGGHKYLTPLPARPAR